MREITKEVEKKKAYHVKDEYSLHELIKELKEQGALVDINLIDDFRNGFIYFFVDDENYINCYTHSGYLKDYNIIEYHKEEPKYYAKIKGWELLVKDDMELIYFIKTQAGLRLSFKVDNYFRQIFTKEEWNKLGINDTNADFEEVEK